MPRKKVELKENPIRELIQKSTRKKVIKTEAEVNTVQPINNPVEEDSDESEEELVIHAKSAVFGEAEQPKKKAPATKKASSTKASTKKEITEEPKYAELLSTIKQLESKLNQSELEKLQRKEMKALELKKKEEEKRARQAEKEKEKAVLMGKLSVLEKDYIERASKKNSITNMIDNTRNQTLRSFISV